MAMNVSYAWYFAAIVMVALMINTFDLWQAFASSAGSIAVAGPIVAALVALTGSAIVIYRQGNLRAIRFALIGSSIAVAAIGLALTDPQFPAKRIHVAEYIAVAWLVYRGLGRRLGGPRRAAAAVLIATLLGVHDELVQGLHTQRTFGVLDIVTNGLGAGAGALAALAMTTPLDAPDATQAGRHVVFLVLVLCSTMLAYPLIAAQFGLRFQ
jgi:hypothetical protein